MRDLLALNDTRFAEEAARWLDESGAIAVEWSRPYTRSGWQLFIITGRAELHNLIARCRPGDWLSVARGRPFPIRGIVGPYLIARAVDAVDDDTAFIVSAPAIYPHPVTELASGTGRRVVERALNELVGTEKWFGPRIRWIALDDLTLTDAENYLYGCKTR